MSTILRDSDELLVLHSCLHLCAVSPTNVIILSTICRQSVLHSWAQSDFYDCVKKTTFSHNSALFKRVTSFMVAYMSSLAQKLNNFRLQFVGSLRNIHKHSQNTLTV